MNLKCLHLLSSNETGTFYLLTVEHSNAAFPKMRSTEHVSQSMAPEVMSVSYERVMKHSSLLKGYTSPPEKSLEV